MKHFILIAMIFAAVFNCSRSNKITGTADDVNSGSLYGKLLTDSDGGKNSDSTTVFLHEEDTVTQLAKKCSDKEELRKVLSIDGTYQFDSLPAGIYGIEVVKEGILLGEKHGITLGRNERKEVNITIVIIINQTFSIWTDESQNITINNFYIDNGKIEKLDSGYAISYARVDTLVFQIEIEKDGVKSIVNARIVQNSDGTSSFQVIEDSKGIVITPGTDPVPGYIDNITIDVKEPGTIIFESSFDTSSVPKRSQ